MDQYVALLFSLVLGSACSDLSEFRTQSDEVYRGVVFGTERDCETQPCSFIRRGFPNEAVLEMDFDPSEATGSPGSVTVSGELCDPALSQTPLLPIPPLFHDQLSQYDFPGNGRLRNYLFLARPSDGPLSGRDAMVFVSLIRGGRAEVRVIAGTGQSACDPSDCDRRATGDCDFFGVFALEKTQR